MQKRCTSLLLGVLVLAGLMVGWVVPFQVDFGRSLPVYDGAETLPGLIRPVTIERDGFAVPHIRAENLHDLFMAQGYATAQDRLWQLDFQRRLASGRLAEIFISSISQASDRFYRRLGLQRNLRGRSAELSEETRTLLQAYADGINAFIRANRTRLPPEFAILNYIPELWSVEDTLLLMQLGAWSLSTSYPIDLLRQQAAARLTDQQVADLFPSASSLDVIQFPTPNRLKAKRRASKPCSLRSAEIADWHLRTEMLPHQGGLERVSSRGLSNNWVVSGRRSAEGEPLLSNDTHLVVAMPALMTMVHLSAPELQLEGIAIPGAPGIIAGRNEQIAWGVTNLPADVQDLFQVRFKSITSDEYMLDGEWVPAEVVEETIRTKTSQGFTTETLTVQITRFGPILQRRGTSGLAIQWNMFDALAEEWEGFFGMNRAKDWNEFVAALARFPGPSQIVLYADGKGHIGLQAAGRIPLRGAGDGTVPLIGESSDVAWQGWIPYEDLPRRFDPEAGWLVAANQRIVDEEYPHLITKSWGAPFRAHRIATLLQQSSQQTGEDMRRIQGDVFSWADQFLAQQINAATEGADDLTEEEMTLLNELKAWDGTIKSESYLPTVLELTRREVLSRILSGPMGRAWASNYMSTAFDAAEMFVVSLFQQRPARWKPTDVTSYDGLLLESWRQAIAAARAQFGDVRRALWGDYASLFFRHAFGSTSAFSRLLDRGPIRLSGNGLTVNFHHDSLAVGMRLLVDFSQPQSTWATIPSGISGHPLSEHYDDQIDRWKNVNLLQLPFSTHLTQDDVRHRLTLQPDEAD